MKTRSEIFLNFRRNLIYYYNNYCRTLSKSAHMIIPTHYATPENNFLSCMKVENIFEMSNNYKLLRKSINSQYRTPKCDFL